MDEVEDYICRFEGQQREVLLHFHRLLALELGLKAVIRYRIPFYDGRSWVCYLNPRKGGEVELAFTRGNELSNFRGLLIARGRKQVRGYTATEVAGIPQDWIYETLLEAIELDRTTPYPSKRIRRGELTAAGPDQRTGTSHNGDA